MSRVKSAELLDTNTRREMCHPEERTIDTVTSEILELKRTAGEAILDIGTRLIEAKGMLAHGEWLPWLNERVELSERTAQKFMKLAREWSNPNTLADLGASKALMLLALPAEERDRFAEEHNVIDMSARQLEQAIKDRDEARKAAEYAKADAAAAEAARAKMAEDMRLVNDTLKSARAELEQANRWAASLEQKLAELKARPVDVAVETVVDQEAIVKARAEAVAEMETKLNKARKAAETAKARQQEVQARLEETRKQLEEQTRATRLDTLAGDKELAQFEVFFNQGQELANKLRGLLIKARARKDKTVAQGMEKALTALAEAIGRCTE